MGCGCGKSVQKQGTAKQVVKTGSTKAAATRTTGVQVRKPVTRRVIKRPAR